MEVKVKQAELKQLREQLSYLRGQRERCACQRRSREHRYATTGVSDRRLPEEGDLFAAVEDDRIMRAEDLAPETDIGEVELDKPVRLRVWAYPLRDFTGRVVAVAPIVEPKSDNPFMRVVRVTIEIPNSEGLLRSQMTGFAKISAGEKPFIVAFTRALVRFVMIEMWSWLP